MNKKRWVAVAIAVFLLIVYIRTDVNPDQSASNSWRESILPSKSFSTETYKAGNGKTIALIQVEGIIQSNSSSLTTDIPTYDQKAFLQEIEEAFERSDIKAVVLSIDSPGGGVYESDEVYQKLMQLKKKYHKPLIVSMGSMAASGGYYIATPADKILATRDTLTGSIGVILSTYNYSQLADKIGIKEEVFKSGKNKDLLDPMRDVTPEERQIMQGVIDESYGYFIQAVADGRHMDRQKVISLADGRIYTAKQALALGLIDKIGNLDDAINTAADMINENNPQVLLFKNENPFSLERLFSMVSMKADLLDLKNIMDTDAAPSLMYLYR